MATLIQYYHGARPKTLFAAASPVVLGATCAYAAQPFSWAVTIACFIVGVALQVGVNYANDYSDGIRGTDEQRVGPIRLVGQKLASPQSVRRAALIAFFIAGVSGIVVAAMSSWWMIAVGAACIFLAWTYTGTSHPYGYFGLGEVVVFICFGLVATVGTYYANTVSISSEVIIASVIPGMFSVMVLLANNIRDISGDKISNKKTLPVRIGEKNAKALFVVVSFCIVLATIGIALTYGWVFVALIASIFFVGSPVILLYKAHTPPQYISVLVASSRYNFIYSIIVSTLIFLSRNA